MKGRYRIKDSSISEAVSLILIIGIVIGVSAAAFAVYLPAHQAQEEQDHRVLLEKEFAGLKSSIDLLWLNSAGDRENRADAQFSPSVPISLPVLFSLSADHVSSCRLDTGAETFVFTAGDKTVPVPLLSISCHKNGQGVYTYKGVALFSREALLLPASANSKNAVLICSSNPETRSYYATDPVSLKITIDSYQQYHTVSFDDAMYPLCGTSSADTVTLVFCSVTEGA